MGRYISIAVLLLLVVAFGALFFQALSSFILPLFVAALLAVIFRPVHCWFTARCGGYVRVAARLTTLAILLIVMVPLFVVAIRAGTEAFQVFAGSNVNESGIESAEGTVATNPDDSAAKIPSHAVSNHAGASNATRQALVDGVRWLNSTFSMTLDPKKVEQAIWERVTAWLQPMALGAGKLFISLVIGFFIMTISLYYFLADGEQMIIGIGKLLPLDLTYQQQLLDQFASVSRAVASATLLSALAQGILAGIGYYFADLGSLFLLTMVTMVAAMIPFVGAAVVWIPCSLWLYFAADRPVAAIGLAIWGGAVVSMVDNLIKPFVLQGQSKLHPLLALLSVLGGAEALGPIGIFVGPMAVAFLQAGLQMLNTELNALKQESAGNVTLEAPVNQNDTPSLPRPTPCE
ncbi:MAG: AI-2E family transporter [Planctomycetota bacterium]|nr:AI-2E family transporter [Planctomycetota bacterium]